MLIFEQIACCIFATQHSGINILYKGKFAMAIVETKIRTRPDVTVPFFHHTSDPLIANQYAQRQPFITSGNVSAVETISSDQTTSTSTTTFDTIDTWKEYETNVQFSSQSFAYSVNHLAYMEKFGHTMSGNITNVAQSLTLIETYTIPNSAPDSSVIVTNLVTFINTMPNRSRVANVTTASNADNSTVTVTSHCIDLLDCLDNRGYPYAIYNKFVVYNGYENYITHSSTLI